MRAVAMASSVTRVLAQIETDWSAWRLFFCDERLVAPEDKDSTWGLYRLGGGVQGDRQTCPDDW